MPIAKEPLRVGNLVVARAGNYVSRNAVEHYGWQDLVDDDDGFGAVPPIVNMDLPAESEVGQPKPKRRRRT